MGHDHDHDHANCDHDHDHDHAPSGEGPALTAVLEELGPCKKLLKVEVPKEEVEKEIENRFRHLRKSVQLKGFRRGKAPRKRIEKMFGKDVQDDARDHLLRQGYVKALKEQVGERKLLGEGTIENVNFSTDTGLKFEVTIHTRPEFDLGDYKGIEVTLPVLRVEDKHLEEALDQFRRTRGEHRPVEGDDAVVEGEDQLSVDVEVWLADEYETWVQSQSEGGETTDLKPLKEEFGLTIQLPFDRFGQYAVEDLADSLTGLKVGEWGEVETELAPDYEVVEGRNEPAMLRVCVQSINRLFLPELTDEWVKEAGYDTVNDLKRELRDDLQQRMEILRRREVEEKVLIKLQEQVGEFALPDELVEKEVESAVRRRMLEMRIQEGRSEDEARQAAEDGREELRGDVERNLRHFFLLDEVANREEISVSERDIEGRIALMAAQRGESPRKIREELERHNVINQLHHDLMDERTRGFLREHASIVEDEDL